MVTVNNLTKKYGKFTACDNIDLAINPGEIAILLGPNGAGKSTLIKSICGLLRFTGRVTIDGFDNRSVEAKRILGYVPEFPTPYPMLTVEEHLEFIAKAYRLKDWKAGADDLIKRFDLDDKRNKLGKELSKGMQQKVSVCCALLPDPKLVILDEPLVGLDPHGIRELKNTIKELRNKGKSLLISTHIIDSIEDDWDTTFIMNKGRFAREVRRSENFDESLEDIYFSIIDNDESQASTGEAIQTPQTSENETLEKSDTNPGEPQ